MKFNFLWCRWLFCCGGLWAPEAGGVCTKLCLVRTTSIQRQRVWLLQPSQFVHPPGKTTLKLHVFLSAFSNDCLMLLILKLIRSLCFLLGATTPYRHSHKPLYPLHDISPETRCSAGACQLSQSLPVTLVPKTKVVQFEINSSLISWMITEKKIHLDIKTHPVVNICSKSSYNPFI